MRITSAIALLLLIGGLSGCDQKTPPQAPAVSSAALTPQNGRFVIVFSPLIRTDTFLLDTQSGRIWTPTKYEDLVGEPTVWEDMLIIDSGGKERILDSITTAEFFKAFPKKEESKKKP